MRFIKFFYNLIPFKKYIYSAIKDRFTLPHNIYQHLTFNGPFTVKIDNLHQFELQHFGAKVENEIFWKGLFGNWEKETLKIWTELCKTHDFIFDIGANSGVFALIAKCVNANSSVHAFEPVNRIYNRLKQNIQLNQFNIEAYELGVSNNDGEAIIYDPGFYHLYSVTINKNILDSSIPTTKIKIKIEAFKSWYIKNNIEGLDLIKLDVETHEAEVIEGMLDLLTEYQPTFIIEILNKDVASRVRSLLKGIPYRFFAIDENLGAYEINKLHKLPPMNYLICNEDTAKRLKVSNLIS
jgi:FkbM family methyltransferase